MVLHQPGVCRALEVLLVPVPVPLVEQGIVSKHIVVVEEAVGVVSEGVQWVVSVVGLGLH